MDVRLGAILLVEHGVVPTVAVASLVVVSQSSSAPAEPGAAEDEERQQERKTRLGADEGKTSASEPLTERLAALGFAW